MTIDRVLSSMSGNLSEAVRLVYIEGYSFRAAGRILSIDHKTVKSRSDKGMAILREHGIDSLEPNDDMEYARRLRSKLGPEFESIIGTVRNVGYRFTVQNAGRESVSELV